MKNDMDYKEVKNEIVEEILRNILKIILCDFETTIRRSAQQILQNVDIYTNLMFKMAKRLGSLDNMILQRSYKDILCVNTYLRDIIIIIYIYNGLIKTLNFIKEKIIL
ncbi:hypothetical protein PFNF135_04383 [Plasmodium falciparum NF135/5.C10]|uniref:DNAJ-containing protein X-domain domain-containing protein n=1 Tax=Plasmodium falciparum NF135/5.C10 TaxID=1036726 RepID=W4IC36_PLAFA|nr:hypothetical protein PFNF135_04383 [Plasmodium falciparum NF135/5.C10]